VLAAFPPTTRQEVDDLLARLVRHGWLVPAGPRYRFARPACGRPCTGRCPPRGACACTPQRRAGSRAQGAARPRPRCLFQRAFHLRAADEHAGCLGIRARAPARRSAGARRRSGSSVSRAGGSRPTTGCPRARARTASACSCSRWRPTPPIASARATEERELLDRLVDLDLDQDVDPASAARLYLLHGRYAAGTGQFGLARGFLRNAVQLAERTEPARACAARPTGGSPTVQAQIGELVEAAQAVRARPLRGGRAEPPSARACSPWRRSTRSRIASRTAWSASGAALHVLRDLRVPSLGVPRLREPPARAAAALRRPLRAGRLGAARRAVRLAERAGEKRFEAEARARLGALLLDLDRTEEAEAQLREALLCSREIEDAAAR
jgi:hypothetical protein